PSPPVGPALGQAGLNISEFVKAFNAHTAKMEQGVPTPVVVTVYTDRSFSLETKTPPASYFLKQAARLNKGSQEPGREIVGAVTMRQCRDIAEKKMVDLNANDLDAGAVIIAGTARSMGLRVTE
ncbi:MAG: 50S ribosomal protein L11, partial [Alphaproteobacteria bacterium]|nr:50S ribosomal protein L11 [Alphaproteobacteria bacterium]